MRVRVVARRAVPIALVAAVAALGAAAAWVGATRSGAPRAARAPFYLAVGASSSLGVEPTGAAQPRVRETREGYANDVVALEGAQGLSLSLRQVGCPGETPGTMLGLEGGDKCYAPPATQLSVAVRYLRAHRGDPGLVTVDLGFNSLRPCLTHHRFNQACVATGLAEVARDLPPVLARLDAAAGPRVDVVGLTSYDPYLARLLDDPRGLTIAPASLTDFERLDAELDAAYRSAAIPTADVFGAFRAADTSPEVVPHVGRIPTDLAAVCAFTWMCEPKPFGPDNHPNNAGYMVIAQAITAALPPGFAGGASR